MAVVDTLPATHALTRPVSGPLYTEQRRQQATAPETLSNGLAQMPQQASRQSKSGSQQRQQQQLQQQSLPQQPQLQQSQPQPQPSLREQPKSPAAVPQPTSPKLSSSGIEEEATLPSPEQGDSGSQCTYNAERVIGNGTFGIVYSALIVETNETVAIKKVFVDRRYRNRELQLWYEMLHPNIVTLKHAFYTSGDSPDELYLNMVMEYVPETVYSVMKRYAKQRLSVPPLLVQLYTYQTCRALAHLHANHVLHRDIKPQNLLVDASKGHVLKLCDFGSAARVGKGRSPLVAYICSRYYRAPELMFGATNYGTAVDLWSVGCVLAEMIRGRPLFPGQNGVDQLIEIIKVLGVPSRQQILAMNPQYFNFASSNVPPMSWGSVFLRPVGKETELLLTALLQYDPEARVKPLEACAHRFFDELREERTRLPDGQPLPADLFSLTQCELRVCSSRLAERLIPSWQTSHATENSGEVATGGRDLQAAR